MLTQLTPLLMIALACCVIAFSLAYCFSIILAIGINRRLGLLSVLVPFLAFYVCFTARERTALVLRLGLFSLLGIIAFAVPVWISFDRHF